MEETKLIPCVGRLQRQVFQDGIPAVVNFLSCSNIDARIFAVVNVYAFNNLPFEPILFSCEHSGVLEQKMVPGGFLK